MTNVWPDGLPQYVQVGNYTETPIDNAVRSKTEGGAYKIRRRFTAVGVTVQADVLMTDAQKAIFDAFYRTTLMDGALSFDWVLPSTQAPTTFVFTAPTKFAAAGPTNFVATLALQTVP